mmetsp:Transcript_62174/g.172335  ORF Transcript_62174/g.172335 Transcript_62174/m.172335 type:complete len:249 (+) Transcript_62174:266-1012(+)
MPPSGRLGVLCLRGALQIGAGAQDGSGGCKALYAGQQRPFRRLRVELQGGLELHAHLADASGRGGAVQGARYPCPHDRKICRKTPEPHGASGRVSLHSARGSAEGHGALRSIIGGRFGKGRPHASCQGCLGWLPRACDPSLCGRERAPGTIAHRLGPQLLRGALPPSPVRLGGAPYCLARGHHRWAPRPRRLATAGDHPRDRPESRVGRARTEGGARGDLSAGGGRGQGCPRGAGARQAGRLCRLLGY